MMPRPATPHTVEVVTVTRKSALSDVPLAVGADGHHVVAGDGLFRRRDLDLHRLRPVGVERGKLIGMEVDLPARGRVGGELDILRRRRAVILETEREGLGLAGGRLAG